MFRTRPGQLLLHFDHQRAADYSLDAINLEAQCPLDNRWPRAFEPRYSLGSLDILPQELLTNMLLVMDIPALTTLRRVSRSAMTHIEALPHYQMVLRFCQDVLRGIISIDATSYGCGTLSATLSTSRCSTCDHFGNYLYLITCKRVCYPCLVTDFRFFPVESSRVSKLTGLGEQELINIPHIRTIPGRYSNSGTVLRKRQVLYDRQAVLDLLPENSSQWLQLQTVEDRGVREPRRFMAIISAPYLAPRSDLAEWGLRCLRCWGCEDNCDIYWKRKYTQEGLNDHMLHHEETDAFNSETEEE